MAIWVRLKSIQYITIRGEQHKYSPGDWVQVSRQQAQVWLAQGACEIPNIQDYFETLNDNAGIVTDSASKAHYLMRGLGVAVKVQEVPPLIVPYERTMYWETSIKLRPTLLAIGLHLLNTWEIAIPFENYDRLAVSVGSNDERALTRSIIRDLRVPVYSTRLFFAKKLPHIEELVAMWQDDVGNGRDKELSLLRAIYKVKPFILALPTTWIDGRPGNE